MLDTSSNRSPSPRRKLRIPGSDPRFPDYRTHRPSFPNFWMLSTFVDCQNHRLSGFAEHIRYLESESCRPCRTSTINMITSAVSMAICACSRIWDRMMSRLSGSIPPVSIRVKVHVQPGTVRVNTVSGYSRRILYDGNGLPCQCIKQGWTFQRLDALQWQLLVYSYI